MILTAVCLGLRVRELLGLKWEDLDFENLAIRIQRSISEGELNETKTETSEATLPQDPGLTESLLMHKRRSAYTKDSDYIFANKHGKPRWLDTIRKKVLQPAAKRAGINKRIGWHTFRHTYSSLLHSLETPLIVQKELLRHADIRTTMDYTQSIGNEKRETQLKVAELLRKDLIS